MATQTYPSSIGINNVASELGLATYSMSQLYATCMVSGYGGLMYHNVDDPINQTTPYGMGISSNLDAKVAIYDPYNTGSKDNLKMSNWYNYYQDIEIVYDVEIYNSSSFDVTLTLWLRDQDTVNQFKIFSGTIPPSTSEKFNKYCAQGFYTSASTGGYDFYIDSLTTNAQSLLGQFVFMADPTVFDTDNVGANVNRTGYAAPTNPFDDNTKAQSFVVCDDNGSLISINKRTTVIIEFL